MNQKTLALLSLFLILPAAASANSRRAPAIGQSGARLGGLPTTIGLPGPLGTPQAPVAAPAIPGTPKTFAELTGAVTRSRVEPAGAIKTMWLVYPKSAPQERALVADALARVRAENPGVVILERSDEELLRYKGEGEERKVDETPEARKALADRIRTEGVEFVLTTNESLYDPFRGLRDNELSLEVPFGFAGRRFVSVDTPRASLDPATLSDARLYPHRKYLVVGRSPEQLPEQIGGMKGSQIALAQLLKLGKAPKGSGLGSLTDIGTQILAWRTGQADSRAKARLRRDAHRFAEYLEREQVDVLAVTDPRAAEVLGMMKSMGYHRSLPVLWAGEGGAPDASAIDRSVAGGSLADEIAEAPKLERIPDNFMGAGGVPVIGYEPKVQEVVEKAIGQAPPSLRKKFDIHLLLTNGNGVAKKGDMNAFGHFGLAVTDENGKMLVWTVQYLNGGSFTGGLGDTAQMTLAEYVYGLAYLPGAKGQTGPAAEANAPVADLILKNSVDEAGLEAMRRVAAAINLNHLAGKDRYSFTNKEGRTNCISLVTQLLRAAGFAIADSGVEAPGDKAYEFTTKLARWLMDNQLKGQDFGFVLFDRPAHAGQSYNRISNTALGSPFFDRRKTWSYMNWKEKIWRLLTWYRSFRRMTDIPATLERFAKMATHRLVVGPRSRTLELVENKESPIAKLQENERAALRLRAERVPIEERLAKLTKEILKEGGFQDFTRPAFAREAGSAPAGLGKPLPAGELQARRERRLTHRRLEVDLALNLFDEQLAQRAVDYYKVRIADPLDRYQKSYAKIRAMREKAESYRALMEREYRLLDDAETEQLNAAHRFVELELQRLRRDILYRLGPSVPHDMKTVTRQVSLDSIESLLESSGEDEGKKKGGK